MGRRPKNYQEKLITSERQLSLWRKDGKGADLHVHTNCSFDVLPVKELCLPRAFMKRLSGKALDYITFTDHNTIEAYEILGWDREKLVPGVEMTVCDFDFAGHALHINVFRI